LKRSGFVGIRQRMGAITASVCTHNRARDVALCLQALATQAQAAGMPLIVVDSGSDDENAEKLAHLSKLHGAMHVRMEQPGLSLARNAAHQHADTQWIAYVDDDAVPHADWAARLKAVLKDAPADVALIGGKVIPRWPAGAEPANITERWKLLLSCVDTDGRGDVRTGRNVCGANLAVRRSALDHAGLFPVTLGRTGTRLISGEESYLIERLIELGFRSVYDSSFAVDHRIEPERMTPRWAADRAYWEGVSRVRILKELGRPLPIDLRIAKLAASLPVLLGLRLTSDNPDYAMRFSMAQGSLREQLGLA
jgi:glycosyltransferase involved in cell wall biosynthesis